MGSSDFWLEATRAALAEDRAPEDVTTALLGSGSSRGAVARFVAEERLVVAGLPVIPTALTALDPDTRVETEVLEGDWVESGAVLASARGSAATLLAGERVILNFLQHLSGIATATRWVVEAIEGTAARVTHTRKTTPGLRAPELYAVSVGGGVPNRASLADAVLWKDNHWALLDEPAALGSALAKAGQGVQVVVEVESEAQLEAALAARVTHLLVDNQSPAQVAAWARKAGPRVTIQASGGITLQNARAYADAGAHLIAIGGITHSARAVAIRCELRRVDGKTGRGVERIDG
jgi:nicotinate-nucleotide pyrophosphorylase (carboxylating)